MCVDTSEVSESGEREREGGGKEGGREMFTTGIFLKNLQHCSLLKLKLCL